VGRWRPANNGTGKRIWFVYRDHPEVSERYRWSSNGRLIRYGSMQAAQRAADRLNQEVTIVTSCPPLLDRSYTGRYLRDRPEDGGFVLEVDGQEVTFGPEYRDQLDSRR
jgi:hypothetical protein